MKSVNLLIIIMALTRHVNYTAVGMPIRYHRTPEKHTSLPKRLENNLIKRSIPVDEEFFQSLISDDYYDEPSEWNTEFENAFDEPNGPSQPTNGSASTSALPMDDSTST